MIMMMMINRNMLIVLKESRKLAGCSGGSAFSASQNGLEGRKVVVTQ